MHLKDFQLEGRRWVYHKGMTSITKVVHYFNVMMCGVGHIARVSMVSHIINVPIIFTRISVHHLWYLVSHTICEGPKLDA